MKHTIELAQELFAEKGFELLETEYINSSTRMSYKCTCGNISKVSLSDLKRNKGTNCKECGNKKAVKKRIDLIANPKKLKAYFKKHGCILLSDYVDYYTPLKYICKCGRVGNTAWYSFKKGRRCGCCKGKRNKKYTLEEVKEIFAKRNCELLATSYEGFSVPLKYKCSCGNISNISLGNFKHGNSCFQCGLKKNTGSGNPRWIKNREQKRLNDKFRHRCIGIVHECLKVIGKMKTNHTADLLGYTHQELKQRITNHPNWKKVKDGKWHIDHIFPIFAFLEHKIYDLKIINSLENLRPLSERENVKKSANYDKKAFKSWIRSKAN